MSPLALPSDAGRAQRVNNAPAEYIVPSTGILPERETLPGPNTLQPVQLTEQNPLSPNLYKSSQQGKTKIKNIEEYLKQLNKGKVSIQEQKLRTGVRALDKRDLDKKEKIFNNQIVLYTEQLKKLKNKEKKIKTKRSQLTPLSISEEPELQNRALTPKSRPSPNLSFTSSNINQEQAQKAVDSQPDLLGIPTKEKPSRWSISSSSKKGLSDQPIEYLSFDSSQQTKKNKKVAGIDRNVSSDQTTGRKPRTILNPSPIKTRTPVNISSAPRTPLIVGTDSINPSNIGDDDL